MQPHGTDDILNKLILLFIFDKMEMPLSETTALDICSGKNDWIPYMVCKLALRELHKSNFICEVASTAQSEKYYNVTAEGRVCLAHFFVRIPSTTREIISNFVKNNRMSYRRMQEYNATYTKRDDGSYDVTLQIVESFVPLLEIKINVPTRANAKFMEKIWSERAAKAYNQLFELLSE